MSLNPICGPEGQHSGSCGRKDISPKGTERDRSSSWAGQAGGEEVGRWGGEATVTSREGNLQSVSPTEEEALIHGTAGFMQFHMQAFQSAAKAM